MFSSLDKPPSATEQPSSQEEKEQEKEKEKEKEKTIPPNSEAGKLLRQSHKPSTIHVFYDLITGLFTSIESEYMPHPPPPTDTLRNIFHALKPRWAYDDLFYLAFVPVQPTYELPMLDCLSPLSFKVESIITDGVRRYRMEEKLCFRWKTLENVVCRLQRKLLSRIAGTYLLTVSPPYPSSYGYASEWPTEEKAALAARLARTAFTMRFAFLSYLILKESMKGRRTWQELTRPHDDPVPLSVCNIIRASWVCDFSVPRIGAFVDIGGRINRDGGRQWHVDIDDMLLAGIPLWFGYAHDAHHARDLPHVSLLEFKRHMPTHESFAILSNITETTYNSDNNALHAAQLKETPDTVALDDYCKSEYYGHLVQTNDTPAPVTRAAVRRRSGNTSVYEITLVDGKHCEHLTNIVDKTHRQLELATMFFRYRQRDTDTYETFVLRESAARLYMWMRTGDEERRRMLEREEEQRNQPVPSGKGPAVYAWQLEGGIQFRRRVRTSKIRALWDRTSPAQRTYNPMRNEYDVDDTAQTDPAPEHPTFTESDSNDHWTSYRRSRSASPVPRPPPNNRPRSPIGRPQEPSLRLADNRTITDTTVADDENPGQGPQHSFAEMATTLLSDTGRSIALREMITEVDIDDIEDLLKQRYGYITPKEAWEAQEKEAKEWALDNWDKLYRVLGQRNKDPPRVNSAIDTSTIETSLHSMSPTNHLSTRQLPTAELPAIADFVAAFKRNAPIKDLSDLHLKSKMSHANVAYQSLSAVKYEEHSTTTPNNHTTTTWYMLDEMEGLRLETSRHCRVSTTWAMNIQHMKRAGFGRTAEQILFSMLTRGMTVRLLLPISTPLTTSNYSNSYGTLGNRAVGVGIKPHGIKLTNLDYKTYMDMRDELLAGPVGEAALQSGGILWRLAINTRNIEDAMRGPDLDDISKDSRLGERVIRGQSYAETILTEQDKYVLVGVYRVLLEGKPMGKSYTIRVLNYVHRKRTVY